ncbi:hypothetical protein [Blattabacterium cuenoti]|uniref:hypothetical protein n=1 Tax=Blattabacterium cuenoti TaxID=1653831 RepID=UPI00374203C5
MLRASFLLNKLILEEKIERTNCSYHIVFIYIGKFLPKFQDINPSIKKIFHIIRDAEISSLLK